MDLLQQFTSIVPIGILALTFGGTYFIGLFVQDKEGHSPRWFDGVPWIIGLVFGSLQYFTNDPLKVVSQPWWLNLFSAITMGAIYGGAEVLIWNFIAKKQFGPPH